MPEKIKLMDFNEFRDFGLLQEVNRQFFHPLGLALEMQFDEDTGKATSFGGVWDYRDDPEGMMFKDGTIDLQKIKRVTELRLSKMQKRVDMGTIGGVQQPPLENK